MNTDHLADELKMNAADLYCEEVFSDRRTGTIRRLTPVKPDGTRDEQRKVVFIGATSLLTPMGTLPLNFEIDAATLRDAVNLFGAAAKLAVDRAVKELEEMRREAASSIIIPEMGGGAPGGGRPGSGKIALR